MLAALQAYRAKIKSSGRADVDFILNLKQPESNAMNHKIGNPCKDPLLRNAPIVDGFKILDPCVIYNELGRGGMGVVYQGHHLDFEIDVAIKCLDPVHAISDPQLVDRFRREARAAARVNHNNVVRVFMIGECNGVHYLVMEYILGEDARQRVRRKRRLSLDESLQVIIGAANGLSAAHSLGLVHRDIKPSNVMISSDGQVKLADLGLVKSLGTDIELTASQASMGTPRYMPPEQWKNAADVGPASDIYSLAATLYYLVTGTDAVPAGSLFEVLNFITNEPFPLPSSKRIELPEQLDTLIERCTQKDPKKRIQSASEFANEAKALLSENAAFGDLVDNAEISHQSQVKPPPPETLSRIRTTILNQGPSAIRTGSMQAAEGKSKTQETFNTQFASEATAQAVDSIELPLPDYPIIHAEEASGQVPGKPACETPSPSERVAIHKRVKQRPLWSTRKPKADRHLKHFVILGLLAVAIIALVRAFKAPNLQHKQSFPQSTASASQAKHKGTQSTNSDEATSLPSSDDPGDSNPTKSGSSDSTTSSKAQVSNQPEVKTSQPEAIPEWTQLAIDLRAAPNFETIEELLRTGDPGTSRALIDFFLHDDFSTDFYRENLLPRIAEIGTPAIARVLIDLLDHPELEWRYSALESLHTLTGEHLSFDPEATGPELETQLEKWESLWLASQDSWPPAITPTKPSVTQFYKARFYNSKSSPLPPHVSSSLNQALAWLATQQQQDGSWIDSESALGTSGVTGLALLTFLGSGSTTEWGPYRENVTNGIRYLIEDQDIVSGEFGSRAANYMQGHAIALAAMCEAYTFSNYAIIRRSAKLATRFALESRAPYGVWDNEYPSMGGDDPITSNWMAFALRTSEESGLWIANRDQIYDDIQGSVIDRTDLLSGGISAKWQEPASESKTAEGLWCLVTIDRFNNPDPNFKSKQIGYLQNMLASNEADNPAMDPYSWYCASNSMFQAGGDRWSDWEKSLTKTLVKTQSKDGSWNGSNENWGPISTTSLVAQILETPTRFGKFSREDE